LASASPRRSHFQRAIPAAASLGQVHAAALRDGRAVCESATPGKSAADRGGFEVLEQIAIFFDEHTDMAALSVREILGEFKATLIQELD